MPLKLTIKVGADSIDADGDFTIDEQVVNLTKEWVLALPPQPTREVQEQIDALADKANAANEELAAKAASVGGEFPGSTGETPGSGFPGETVSFTR